MTPTQEQMYYQAQRRSAEINLTFLDMLKGDAPLTNAELQANIDKRPELWGRFAGFIGKLKD